MNIEKFNSFREAWDRVNRLVFEGIRKIIGPHRINGVWYIRYDVTLETR